MRGTISVTNVNTLSKLGQAALEYAAKGWKVFPCVPRGKAPLTKNGFKDGTTDEERIREWWSNFPHANIGYTLDVSTICIDVDPRNGGTIPDSLPDTLSAVTGGGGYHFYYKRRLPDVSGVPQAATRKTLTTGVDIKTEGGYTLLPPSFTAQEYKWNNSSDVCTEIPEWLENAIHKPLLAQQHTTFYDDPTDHRPGTVFNRTTTWPELLIPRGWRLVGTNPDGEMFWCRPGKTEGISATTNYNGSDLLYVFSSSTELEPQRGYTKFYFLVASEYNGDVSAAAKALGAVQVVDSRDSLVLPSTRSIPVEVIPSYSFTPAFLPNHFVSRFVNYVAAQTDAPLEYAEAAALTLLSIAGYRCKSALAPYPGGLSNNLYILLVGPTTVSRKSTVQRITSNIIKAVMPPSVLPNRATTEALIKALAQRSGVPSVWAPDEFGITLAEIYNRDYMRGLEEMLLTVYSGDDYEYQRVLDSVHIRSPHLSVLGAATPESLARAGTNALDSGLLPRFAVVYPLVMPEPKPVSSAVDQRAERQGLISTLNKILEWSNTVRDITFSDDALSTLNAAEQKIIHTSAARLPTMLYKVATLSALADTRAEVNKNDAKAAIDVVTRWSDGVDNLVPQMYRHGSDQQFEQQLEYVLGELDKHGGVVSRVVIANLVNVKRQRLDEIESTLVDKGKIRVEKAGGTTWIKI